MSRPTLFDIKFLEKLEENNDLFEVILDEKITPYIQKVLGCEILKEGEKFLSVEMTFIKTDHMEGDIILDAIQEYLEYPEKIRYYIDFFKGGVKNNYIYECELINEDNETFIFDLEGVKDHWSKKKILEKLLKNYIFKKLKLNEKYEQQ